MTRRTPSSDTMLDIHLSAIIARHEFTQQPAPVVDELRRVAGGRVDILEHVVGTWIGYTGGPYSGTLVTALLTAFPGSLPWIDLGRDRRDTMRARR